MAGEKQAFCRNESLGPGRSKLCPFASQPLGDIRQVSPAGWVYFVMKISCKRQSLAGAGPGNGRQGLKLPAKDHHGGEPATAPKRGTAKTEYFFE